MKTDVAFIGGRGLFSNYGGVENAIREISKRLVKKNLNVDVYGIHADDISFPLTKGLRNISSPRLFYRLMGQYGQILFAVLSVVIFRRSKVVVLFASGPCVFTPFFRLLGIRVIAGLRAIDSGRDKWGRLSKLILRLGEYCAWRFSNEFTVNSVEMYEHYYPFNEKVIYVPNGAVGVFDSDTMVLTNLELEPDGFYLFAARLDPVKRLHVLIEAHKKLPEDIRFPLIVAGGHSKDPEYEKKLRLMADEKIVFLGHVAHDFLDPLMCHCRVFVLPSILEGMSNSLLTAMASAKPVLVADVKANSVVVGNDESVLFLPDDVESLANKLSKLSSDSKYRSDVAARMKEICHKNYSWDKTATVFFDLIQGHISKS